MTDTHATDAERLREEIARAISEGRIAPTDDEVARAGLSWCADQDRETFLSDRHYFRNNWRALGGLTKYVVGEIQARMALAVSRFPAIARAVAAPVGGEAGEIVSLLTTRAHMDAYPVKTREQAAALITSLSARLAEAERESNAMVAALKECLTALPKDLRTHRGLRNRICQLIARTAAPATTTEGGEA